MPSINKKLPTLLHHAERVDLTGDPVQSRIYPADVCDSFLIMLTYADATQKTNAVLKLFHGDEADGSDMAEFVSTQDCYAESTDPPAATTWKRLIEFTPCKGYFRLQIEGGAGGDLDIDIVKQNCSRLPYPRVTDDGITHCTIYCPCKQVCP